MRLLITRPQEDAEKLAALLDEKGHESLLCPFLTIKDDAQGIGSLPFLKVASVQALLFTSANGVRVFARHDKRRSFKVLAVGDATAKEAEAAGFKTVKTASGDVDALAQLAKEACVPEDGPLVHIAGSRIAGDLKGLLEADGFEYVRTVLYHADKMETLPEDVCAEIKEGKIDGVLLYSPRTATALMDMLKKAKLEDSVKTMTAFGLSTAVGEKLEGSGFKEVKTAEKPDQESLLALLPKAQPKPKVAPQPKEAAKSAEKPKPKSAIPTTESKKTPEAKDAPAQAKSEAAPKKKRSWKFKLVASVAVLAVGAGVAAWATKSIWVPQVKMAMVETFHLQDVMAPAAGVNAEDLAQLNARLDRLESRPAPQMPDLSAIAEPIDITPLTDKISALEGQIETIKISNGDDEKLKEFQEIADRLEAISVPDLSGLMDENQRLGSLVETLSARISELEQGRSNVQVSMESAQGQLVALSQLRSVLQTSGSYEAELSIFRSLAEGDDELMALLGSLEAKAASGIASQVALVTGFEATARDIVRAIAVPDDAGWMQETMKNVTSLISVRPAPGQTGSEGTLGVVARAEYNIRRADLAGGLAELQTLEGAALSAAQSWIDEARARLEAQSTLATIQAHLLGGGQG